MRFLAYTGLLSLVVAAGAASFVLFGSVDYQSASAYQALSDTHLAHTQTTISAPETTVIGPRTTYVETPEIVRAVYASKYGITSSALREPLLQLIEETPLNAIMLDVKDYTGKLSFIPENPELTAYGSGENIIKDIRGLIRDLHERDIYVIGRISTFQDKFLAPKYPNEAVQTRSGDIWRDRKGLAWFDVGSPTVREYITLIAEEMHNVGFDEINLDYIRYPSDGNMRDTVFPISGSRPAPEALKEFFEHMDEELRFVRGYTVSADVFGMTTTQTEDIGIGQIFKDIVKHVDYIAPMIYPSHYPKGFHGYENPAANPYEIITIATKGAIEQLEAIGEPKSKLRNWYQDFDLGATYTADLVFEQIQAGEDLGTPSFMMWDPSNRYTRSAYYRIYEDQEEEQEVELFDTMIQS